MSLTCRKWKPSGRDKELDQECRRNFTELKGKKGMYAMKGRNRICEGEVQGGGPRKSQNWAQSLKSDVFPNEGFAIIAGLGWGFRK